ncbi:MAG: hydrogenase expression/formation protein HypE [archaeon]
MDKEIINLMQGSGGQEMMRLVQSFNLGNRGAWKNCDNDSATLDIDGKKLVFTTDSFIVDPIFFPGGDIGHLAMCGTINDLAVMGAQPLGLSLAFVIEEGFPTEDLQKIVESINRISVKYDVPIVTGDTKVMERGKLDKIIINVSGVGIMKDAFSGNVKKGDKIILSGGLGEHAVALLSKRFDYATDIITDSKPIIHEITTVREHILAAKDPTRGGIASALNEMSERYKVGMELDEDKIPAKEEVLKVVDMLGINLYDLASEGRFVCIVPAASALFVEKKLKEFNRDAAIIGEVTDGRNVIVKTYLGKRILPYPTGRIVPRIC